MPLEGLFLAKFSFPQKVYVKLLLIMCFNLGFYLQLLMYAPNLTNIFKLCVQASFQSSWTSLDLTYVSVRLSLSLCSQLFLPYEFSPCFLMYTSFASNMNQSTPSHFLQNPRVCTQAFLFFPRVYFSTLKVIQHLAKTSPEYVLCSTLRFSEIPFQ